MVYTPEEYQKEYREKNKEKIKEYQKKYHKELYENNKEKIREKIKEYYKTENGKKSKSINCWKSRGVINDDFDKLYDYYLNCKFCEECNIELTIGYKDVNRKCLDHDHKTGKFRNIICNRCNLIRGYRDRGHIYLTTAEKSFKYRLKKFILS